MSNSIQIQPNKWSCTPTAFAMVLGIPVAGVFDYLGHDGSLVLKDKQVKAFHIQELILMAADMGYAVTPMEFFPTATPDGKSIREYNHEDRVIQMMLQSNGVITGKGLRGGVRHTVAWMDQLIYDTNGDIYAMGDASDEFEAECYWRIDRL